MTLLIIGALTLLLAACGGGDTVVQTGNQSGVTATGTGRVFGAPDVVVLTLGVEVERPALEDARAVAANAMAAVVASLKANGVADKDVQTTHFSVNPAYDYFAGQRSLRGYHVANVVTAKLRKVEDASKAIDAAVKAGGNHAIVQSVRFRIDDPARLQAEAREQAVSKAKQYAEELARHSGSGLGEAISITEVTQYTPVYNRGGIVAPATGGSDFATAIESGELEVVITVQVVYALG